MLPRTCTTVQNRTATPMPAMRPPLVFSRNLSAKAMTWAATFSWPWSFSRMVFSRTFSRPKPLATPKAMAATGTMDRSE